jgi:hypothetical protein
MKTDYTITDADVGRVLDVPDGFLVNISQTKSQARYEIPSFDEGKQIWTAGYFVLRGSLDVRDAFCASPQSSSLPSNPKIWLGNSSIAFRGDLIVKSVLRGSEWSVSVSDVPFVRAHESFNDYIQRIARRQIIPPQREVELVTR